MWPFKRTPKNYPQRMAGPPHDPTFWQSSWIRSLMDGGKLQPFKDSPWVHRAILTVVDSLKSVPFALYTGTDDDPQPVENGPWYEFFLHPSTQLTRREFWGQTWQYTQMGAGDSFWLLFGRVDLVDEREIPTEAQVLPGRLFEARMSNGRLDHWLLTDGAAKKRIELHQVLQFAPIRDPDNPNRGISPMDAAIRDIRTDDQAARWNEALLKNGAEPGGLLSLEQDVTKAQADVLRAMWNDAHQGADKANKIGVLGNGAKWQTTSMSHKEMEFQAAREWSREVVSAAFGVPMMFLMVLDDLHKETSRQVRKQLWEQTLLPKAVLAEDVLEARLFAGRGTGRDAGVWGRFDLSGIEALSEEASARRESALKDRQLGIPLNEIIKRHELGYEDQGPSGDVGLVGLALQTVDEAAAVDDSMPDEPPEPPPPPATPEASDDEEGAEGEQGRAATLTDREINARVAKWEGYVRQVLRPGESSMLKIVRGWIRGRRADTLKWVGSQRSVGASTRAITDDEVSAWLASQRQRWHELLAKQTKRADTLTIELTLDRAESQIGELTSIDMQSPAILDLIEARGGAKIKTVETMQKSIRRGLLEGASQGETIAELQERVRGIFKVEASRAQTIARTETASAASQAKEAVYDAEGIKATSWLTAGDGQERETHAVLDGEVRDRGTPFSNGLMYPLDPNGPAEEVINCRCEALPEV